MKSALRGEVRRHASPTVRPGGGDRKAQELHALVAHLDVDRDLRDQRDAIAVGDHLHDGGQAGGAEPHRPAAARAGAERQRLVAQAVTFLQQDQAVVHRCRAATRRAVSVADVGRRHREQERIVEQLQGLDVGLVERQRQHHRIELAAGELFEQHLGLGLAQFDLQVGIAALKRRQHPRQHVGRQRRDHAQRQPSGQHAAAMPGEIDQIARRRQDLLGCAPRPPCRCRSAPRRPDGARPPARQAAAPGRGSAWTAPAGSPSRRRRPGRNAGARPARPDISTASG